METLTPVAPKLTPYQNKLRLNRKYYHHKYDNDPTFREQEIERNKIRVKSRYESDPEYRQKMIDNAKARYYRLKAQTQ